MTGFQQFQESIANFGTPILFLAGILIFLGFFAGKSVKFLKLPSLIGYMIIGVLLGPSLFNLISPSVQGNLSFITEVCLGFVALSIGLELKFSTLKQQGWGMGLIIIMESFLAAIIVTILVYLVTKDIALALIFGAIAPASAPAGTVAIIQEFRAKGPLTKALYTVVGFDDGLGIIVFGFASAFAKSFILSESGLADAAGLSIFLHPLKEVALSFTVGVGLAALFKLVTLKLKNQMDIFILTFAFVIMGAGLSSWLNLSLILTNMIMGITIVNSCNSQFVNKVSTKMSDIMPLLFVLFFLLAGSNLHIAQLPQLGLVGVVYIIGRTSGLMGGAYLGSLLGRAPTVLRKYLGMGILSQAGVAIGLSLIVKQDFLNLIPDPTVSEAAAKAYEHANAIGNNVITVITATCIFFEVLGPITTKIALKKAGEINI